MSYFNLPNSYKFKLNSMPRGKKSTPINNCCNLPSRVVTIDYNSNCLLCNCDGWLPIPVGKVLDFNSLEEVWNSPTAKILQKDVEDKKYTWCAVDHCGIKQASNLGTNYQMSINIDESCNLACPSCRREKIMHVSGPEVENKTTSINRIITWLENFEHPIHITLSGNGDPLASVIIRPLFKNLTPNPSQTFTLFTNGLLIKKQVETSPLLPQIKEILISVDAGSAEVYEKIRIGGNWNILLENFEFLKSINKNKITRLNFAIQNNNLDDIFNFIDLCVKYDFTAVLHQIDDWGTWSNSIAINPDTWTLKNGTFMDNNVLDHTHPNFEKCRDIIKKVIELNNAKVCIHSKVKQLLNL